MLKPNAAKICKHFAVQRWLWLSLLPALLALPLGAMARSEADQDRARAALQAGEIQPLTFILARLALALRDQAFKARRQFAQT